MKEYDIARALTQVSDDLLLEAEHAGARKRTIKFHRLVAVAAVIAMLAVTVGAVSVGITWNIEPVTKGADEVYSGYYKPDGDILDFEKLEFSVPLQRVELPEAVLMRVRNVLSRHWDLVNLEEYRQHVEIGPDAEFIFDAWSVDSYMEHFAGCYGVSQKVEHCFDTLEDVEELLGIGFAVPEELRQAIREDAERYGFQGLGVRIFTGKTYAEVRELKGWVSPTEVIVSWQLQHYCGNGTLNGSIVIPLTDETARSGLSGLSYSYEKEGAIWQEEQTIGGREVVLFGNDPEADYDGWSEAVYTEGGIGYCISARREAGEPGYSSPWPFYDSAKEMVLSVLTDGE